MNNNEEQTNAENYYTVSDDREASRAFWIIRKEQQKIDDYEQQYQDSLEEIKKEKKRLDDALERAKEQPQGVIDSWENALQLYLDAKQAEDPHFRLKTVNGRAVTRKKQDFSYDKDELTKYLTGTKFVESTPKLKWGDFKKTLTITDDGRVVDENGEIVPDMTAKVEKKTYFYPESTD